MKVSQKIKNRNRNNQIFKICLTSFIVLIVNMVSGQIEPRKRSFANDRNSFGVQDSLQNQSQESKSIKNIKNLDAIFKSWANI